MFLRKFAVATTLWFIQSAALAASAETVARSSAVSTIAGDGRSAIAEGAALSSGFVLPVGVSASRDGSALIADAGANAIFRLKNGSISRVAGAIEPIRDTEGSGGGFKNGDARSARFQRPSAALEDAAGRILVADTGNHCIRVVENGRVSVYAGSPSGGSNDGTVQTAGFSHPNGLAIDPAGNVFVSDFGVGIRKIDRTGMVTTVPGSEKKTTNGVAVARVGERDILAYTDYDAIHIIVDGKEQTLLATRERMPTHESVPVFHGWGIAILNENTVVVSDPVTSVIRLVRFPALPFTDIPASESVSGTLHEDTDFHGGFHDGATTDALYNSPRGIAFDKNGNLLIADAGNRRIRSLSGIDGRETVLPDFSNYAPVRADYNVDIIGQSLLFNGARWADSIPSTGELALGKAKPAFARPVHVHGIRADAIDFTAMSAIANEYVVDRGNVDAVAFMLTPVTYAAPEDVVAEANLLASSNIKTVVIVLPRTTSFSLAEYPYNGCGCVDTAADIDIARAEVRAIAGSYRRAGLHTIAPLDKMIESESSTTREALWDAADTHYTPAGQRLLGRIIAADLSADRTWLVPNAKRLRSPAETLACPMQKAPVAISPDYGSVDRIVNVKTHRTLESGVTLSANDPLLLGGWAFDRSRAKAAHAVCIAIDGNTGASATGTITAVRADVARALGHIEALTYGFELTLAPNVLTPGEHTLGVVEIDDDGSLHSLTTPFAITVI